MPDTLEPLSISARDVETVAAVLHVLAESSEGGAAVASALCRASLAMGELALSMDAAGLPALRATDQP